MAGIFLVPQAECLPRKWTVSLAPRLMTRSLNLVGFRETVKTRFSEVMETVAD